VTFDVGRLNGNLDPALSFYSGTTSADASLFKSGISWGGLTFIGSLDDEHPPGLTPGPGGDPFGSFVLPTTGKLHHRDRGVRQHGCGFVPVPPDDDDGSGGGTRAVDLGDVHDRLGGVGLPASAQANLSGLRPPRLAIQPGRS
jgi:hypothetical protein